MKYHSCLLGYGTSRWMASISPRRTIFYFLPYIALGLRLFKDIVMVECNVGDAALCRAGFIGLILKKKKTRAGYLYTGIHLRIDKIGMKWQSQEPTKLNLIVKFPNDERPSIDR